MIIVKRDKFGRFIKGSKICKGRKNSKEHIENIKIYWRKHPDEWKKRNNKISQSNKGQISNNKGKPMTKEQKEKIRQAHLKRWEGKRKEKRPRHERWEYLSWKRKVFERDDFICQKCGDRGRHLNAHHIKSWVKYPKLRFEINNGITLCIKCHKLIHKKYENKD